jgi:hypothetical protein
MTSENQISDKTVQRLRSVRQVLLRFHKTLLDFERQAYERAHGRIGNSYEFLDLVMHNPWFAWLRQLSELIVQIDELLDADSSRESTAVALIEQSRLLLTPTEAGDEFQRKYFLSVQQSPEVVLAHAEFAKLLGPARLSKEIH